MRIIPVSYKEAARQKNIFLGLFQKEPVAKSPLFSYLPASHQRAVRKLAQQEFRGEWGETKSVWFPTGAINRIRLFGWGEKSKWNERKIPLVPRRYVQYAKAERIAEFAAAVTPASLQNQISEINHFAANALMAQFEYLKHKETPKGGWPEVKTIFLAMPAEEIPAAKKEITAGIVMGEEINAARELANTPGSDMTPAKLAEAAVAAGKKTGVKVKILDEPQIKKLGMGGVLGVARGSDEKPK
ncbi:MAG: M17 family peptidase N-terminal domain-containing protein, partial [Patescibacteria group bacterium]